MVKYNLSASFRSTLVKLFLIFEDKNAMRNFKKILLTLSIAATMAAFSTASLAEKAKIPALDAIAAVVTKVNEATAMITAGSASKEEMANAIRLAKDATKEVSANDRVDFKRQRAQQEMKKAIAEMKDGKSEAALETLKATLATLEEMKGLVNE